MKITRVLIHVFLTLISLQISAQTEPLFTKNNFKDVLISCKDVEFKGATAFVEFRSSKYEGLYDGLGNLNRLDRDIPLGDLKVEYSYTVTNSDGKSAVGMTYMTTPEDCQEYFVYNFMISPNGELWFYAKKTTKYLLPLPEKDYVVEPCSSIRKGEAINQVAVIRHGRHWFLVINSDTVKKVIEPTFQLTNGKIISDEQAPVMKYQSNVLLHKGKQKIQFIKSAQTFFAINKELDEVVSLLKNLTGHYSLTPDCKSGSSTYMFEVQVQYIQEGYDHKVWVTGITLQPRYYYLRKNGITNDWYCDLNENDILVYEGKKFNIKRLNFSPNFYSSSISFNLELREVHDNTIYSFDCRYFGRKKQ